ncbi:hypothetical protein POM88_031308 [Heracleum sosnowskyi]|uniref:Uncharacterized protein n=1 Tax=Heracleum sosnowskyi TaxID=360622 RepID=A0AAD8I034_9APIA|nr:hypothetical protein POM88_031308 [Heracleum sosnowskyi]
MMSVEEKERDEAHLHVLLNNPEVYPYIMMHKDILERTYRGKKKTMHWLIGEHNRLFATCRDYHEVYNDDDLGDTIMENPSFCSEIPVVNVAADDDDDPSVSNQRDGVEGIWIKK